jgi:hypothetical protein
MAWDRNYFMEAATWRTSGKMSKKSIATAAKLQMLLTDWREREARLEKECSVQAKSSAGH